MLSNLNQSQITAGFLYNKTAMFTNLYDFNRGNYNLSHADHFKQSVNELYYASEQTKFMSASQLKTVTASTPKGSVDIGIINTTITMLNFNEKNPSTGGLTFPVDRFVPIAGRPSFLTRKILLASPLKESTSGTSVTYKFSAPFIYNNATTAIKNLVVYFDNATPVSIINNSALLVPTKTITYSTSGKKALKFVATFTDNSTITTVGYHYFNYVAPQNNTLIATPTNNSLVSPCTYVLKDRDTVKSTIAFQGYVEPFAYYGKFERTVFYHQKNPDGSTNTTQKTILKPIIIIDGFDPGDTRKTTDCDCEMDISEEGCFEKYSKDNGGVFNALEHESIEDNMYYNVINSNGELTRPNLIQVLRDLGYDVIILNIPTYYTSAEGSAIENKLIDGGADYVERNGRALASYLKSTKSTLLQNGSNEDIVIMGPSMGGLISRYALAYMEKRYVEETDPIEKPKWKHNTRLWVSFDSPHLGANIPVGAQANIWFFGEKLHNVSAKEKFDNQLNSIAGKQLLISQFSNTLATMNNGIGTSNNVPFYNQFQSNLNSNGVTGSNGFPVSVPNTFRKIAIVNGSLNGTKGGVEGGEFLNIRGYKDPTIFEGAIAGAVTGGSFGGWAGIGFGAITGGLFGASNANITLLRSKDNFYPAYGQTNYIFQGDGQSTLFNIGFNHWYIDFSHPSYSLKGINNDIRGSLDVVPAGTFTTGKILREEIVNGIEDAGISSEIRGTNIDTHSFIPSFSSLAHTNPWQNWSNPLNTNLACTVNKQTPFDSYFGLATNTPHIFLTKESVDWLLKELAGQPQVPNFPVQENALVGPAHICKDVNSTYTFDDVCKIPSAVIYEGNTGWSVEGNLAIVSFTEYSVIVKGTSDQYSTGIIKARFQNGYTLEKEIIIGKPTYMSQAIQNGYDNVSVNSSSNLKVNPPLGAKEYYWTIIENSNSCGCYTTSDGLEFCPSVILKPKFPNGSTYSYTSSSTWANINWGNCKGTYIVNCYSKNECGLTPINHKVVTVYSNTGGGFDPCEGKLVVFPNPINKNKSNDEIVVNLIYPPDPCDNPTVSGKAGEINNEVKIYDFYGTLLFSQRYNSDDFKISNLSLKPGNYILNVFTSKGFQKKEIIFVE